MPDPSAIAPGSGAPRTSLLPMAIIAACAPVLLGCATQRFGRLDNVSAVEGQELTCREVRIEQAKGQAFLTSVRQERAGLNGSHILGFLGDFGIGNVIEGNAAEASGEARMRDLRALYVAKGCAGQV